MSVPVDATLEAVVRCDRACRRGGRGLGAPAGRRGFVCGLDVMVAMAVDDGDDDGRRLDVSAMAF